MKIYGSELNASVHINGPKGDVKGTYISFFVPLSDQRARNTLLKYISAFRGKDFSIEIKGADRISEHINS